MELARQEQALIFVLEHRYYGESYPVEDMSLERLRFLSSAQALADLAWFITWVSSASPDLREAEPPLRLPASTSQSPWIAFGGSYPGNLAAWLKLKYPHLVLGSVASSAPLQAEYNFEQYGQVVGEALGNPSIGGGPRCRSAAEEGAAALRRLVVSTAPYGASPAIPPALRPCGRLAGDLDLSAYEAEVFGLFQGVVQYNAEAPGQPTVADVCGAMAGGGGGPVEALAAAVKLVRSAGEEDRGCVSSSFEEDIVAPLSNASFSGEGCAAAGACSMERQWIYQSCREFGYFQTTTGPGNPFAAFATLTVENAGAAICEAAFGIREPPAWEWTNAAYGGRNLEGSNITLVNGDMDPWHSLGIINATARFHDSCTDGCTRQAVTPSEEVVFLRDTAHCRDMYASRGSDDPPSVPWAHARIRRSVARWLGRRLEGPSLFTPKGDGTAGLSPISQ